MRKLRAGISIMLVVALLMAMLPTNSVIALDKSEPVTEWQETITQLGDIYDIDWIINEQGIEETTSSDEAEISELEIQPYDDELDEEGEEEEGDEEEGSVPLYNVTIDSSDRSAVDAGYDAVGDAIEPASVGIMSQAPSLDGQYEYTVSGVNATITAYYGNERELTIPEMIDGFIVTAIGNNAFNGLSLLETVSLPNSLRTIGNGAFQNCTSLHTISLNLGLVSIGSDAFRGCSALSTVSIPDSVTTLSGNTNYGSTFVDCVSLTSVTIGSGLTGIPVAAFSGCRSLSSITIGRGTSVIGTSAFIGCTSLATVNFSADSILNAINESAFSGCSGLTSIVLPNNLRSIGNNAFQHCNALQSVVLNNGLVSIGAGAFGGCSALGTVSIPDSVTTLNGNGNSSGSTFLDCSSLTSVAIGTGLTEIPTRAFSGCRSLNSITIGSRVSEIGSYAFDGCTSLASVNLSSAGMLNAIGTFAFNGCTVLTSIALPNNLRTIGNSAFSGCTALQTVSLNEGLVSVGNQAFRGCSSLGAVSIPDSVTTLSGNVSSSGYTFADCISLASVSIGEDSRLTEIPRFAFSGCRSLNSIVVRGRVSEIGASAFAGCTSLASANFSAAAMLNAINESAFIGCTGLTSIVLPNGVRTLGNYVFQNCTALQTITLNPGLVSIGYEAFRGCSAIGTLTIPDSVTTLNSNSGNGATFRDCTSLTSVDFGAGLTEIPQYAFYNCRSLDSVILGNRVSDIGAYAFYGCTGLTSISFPGSLRTIGSYAFQNCTALQTATLNAGLVSIGYEAFRSCSALSVVNIPNSVTTINSNASANSLGYTFADCVSLTSLTIGSSLTEIPRNAFSGCRSLTSVSIGSRVFEIGTYAFSGCMSLATVNFSAAGMLNSINAYAFNGCTSLGSTTLPNGLRTIGNYAFFNCTALRTIVLNEGLISIGSSAFRGCSSLSAINIPDSVTTLNGGTSAGDTFRDCTSLTSAVIGSKVQLIPQYAFYGNIALSSVILGNSVSDIGVNAFYNCISLRSITFGSSLRTIGAFAFFLNISLPSLVIPNTVISIGDNAFLGCRGFTQVVVGSNVKTIGDSAFRGNTSLEDVTIGASVVTIGDSAFRGNTGLRAIEFSSSVQQIGANAFRDCSGLVNATIPPNVWKFGNGINAGTAHGSNIFTGASLGLFTIIGVPGSPAEEFAMNNGYLFAALGDFVTLDVDESTNRATINVSGSAPSGKVVSIYDGNAKIGEFTTSVSRRYGGNVTMVGGYGARKIRAEIVGDDGNTLSVTKTVIYEENAPRLVEFIMFHDGQRIDLMTTEGIRQTLIFRQGSPFTFEVKVENSGQLNELYICSERNGIIKHMKSVYDANTDIWLANGYFDPSDTRYVPGRLSVGFLEKIEPQPIDLDFSFSASQLEYIRNNIGTEWMDAKAEFVVNTSQRQEIVLTLADEAKTRIGIINERQTSVVKTEPQLLAEGYDKLATTDGNYIYAKIDIAYPNPNSRVIDYDEYGIATVKAYDLRSGIEDSISFGLSFLPGGKLVDVGTEVLGTGYSIGSRYASDYRTIRNNIDNSNLSQAEKDIRRGELDRAHGWNIATNIAIGAAAIGLGILFPPSLLATVGIAAGSIAVSWFANLMFDFRYAGINNGAHQIRIAIDPSGYVYEAVTSNRLPGVTVTVYHKGEDPLEGTIEDEAYKWDAGDFDQLNPLITDHEGRYSWDVPEGLWQVKAELEGYDTAYSTDRYGWLPVPPPQLEVDIGMVSKASPEVAWFNVYDTYAEVEFTKYMKPETVNELILKTPDGVDVPYTLLFSDKETCLDGIVYAKRYQLAYDNSYIAAAGNYSLTTSADIMSYAGIPTKAETHIASYELPISLILPESVDISYNTTKDIEVAIQNYDPSKPLILRAEVDFEYIAQVVSVSDISTDGRVTIRVSGNMPGPANIIIRIAEKGIEAVLPVWINMPGEDMHILISPVAANVPKGGTQQFAATESTSGAAVNVTWSVSGNQSEATSISVGGLLTVAEEETAETLTITAVSVDDGSKYSVATVSVTTGAAYLLGDVTGNGEIDIGDVNMLYLYVRGRIELTEEQLLAADVTKNGAVDIGDVNLLYLFVRGRISTL